MTDEHILDLLGDISIMKVIDEEYLGQIAGMASRRSIRAGHALFLEGAPGKEIYLVEEGEVLITLSQDSQTQSIEVARLGRGEVLGEVSFITSGEHTANATAAYDTSLLVWTHEALRHWCENNPAYGYRLINAIAIVLAERLHQWNKRVA